MPPMYKEGCLPFGLYGARWRAQRDQWRSHVTCTVDFFFGNPPFHGVFLRGALLEVSTLWLMIHTYDVQLWLYSADEACRSFFGA